MDSQTLQTKGMKELRDIARELKLPGVKAESADNLRARIAVVLYPNLITDLQKPPTDTLAPESATKAIERYDNTQADVIEALSPYKSRLKLAFNEEENTWHVKNGVAEDSGSMNMPLKVIKLKAEHIYRARLPAVVDGSEFEPGRQILSV